MSALGKVEVVSMLDTEECPRCDGEGYVLESYEPMPGGGMRGDDQRGQSVDVEERCRRCRGTGRVPS